MIGSDVDAIVKASLASRLLVFAQDMKKPGEGGAKARKVLVSDGYGVILEKTTGDDGGMLLTSWDKPRDPSARPLLPDSRRRPTSPRSRPRASPGEIVRRASLPAPTSTPTGPPTDRARLSTSAGSSARRTRANTPIPSVESRTALEVFDTRGRSSLIAPAGRRLSKFGTFHEIARPRLGKRRSARIASGSSSRARATSPEGSRSSRTGSRRSTSRSICPRPCTTAARRSQGTSWRSINMAHPSLNKLVEVVFPGGLRKAGRTDGSGRKFHVEFVDVSRFAEEQGLQIVAAVLVDENVGGVARTSPAGDPGRSRSSSDHDARHLSRRRVVRAEGQGERPTRQAAAASP